LQNSRFRNIAAAAALGAACVLFCFADVFFGPYMSKNYRPNPPTSWVLVMAAAAAALAVVVAVAWPRGQASLIRILAVTAFIYLIYRPLAMPWSFWLATFPLTPAQQFWLYRGPGGAIGGLFPSAVAVLLGGRYLFGMTLREQWNGRLRPTLRDLIYGGGIALALSAVFLAGLAATGNGRVAWEPDWAGHGANLFSNLYEELLARGLLLQVTCRTGGKWFGILWTALVFGAMHPFGWYALGVALTTWILAWVILRAGSLWAGYILHQGLDFFMDSFLH
jgi:membrane protease YdiL (CAAX protease family)